MVVGIPLENVGCNYGVGRSKGVIAGKDVVSKKHGVVTLASMPVGILSSCPLSIGVVGMSVEVGSYPIGIDLVSVEKNHDYNEDEKSNSYCAGRFCKAFWFHVESCHFSTLEKWMFFTPRLVVIKGLFLSIGIGKNHGMKSDTSIGSNPHNTGYI